MKIEIELEGIDRNQGDDNRTKKEQWRTAISRRKELRRKRQTTMNWEERKIKKGETDSKQKEIKEIKKN